MLFNLSDKPDLQPLVDVVRPLQEAAAKLDAPLFLMGAAARDVMLLHAFGIKTLRQTEDIDFGVMVKDWAAFEALRQALLAGGQFETKSKDATHKLWHRSGRPLDIVPFGGVEKPDRSLAWPPNEEIIFDCFGMQEALQSGHDVLLPGDVSLIVPSLPALALLKITAWQDRKLTRRGRDAGDLMLYLRHYLDCDQYDHAAKDYPELFDTADYDHEVTSARLLGLDLRQLLSAEAVDRVLAIVLPESDASGTRRLAAQSLLEIGAATKIIAGLCEGLQHHIK
jgi:predicted nucleotidyltransferase